MAYDRNVGISAPPAGMAPKGKPKAVPRSHGFQDRFQSSRPIHGTPTGTTPADWRRRCAATQRASPTAKMPTATTTTSMPSASWGTPKVSRCCPETESIPTMPITSPTTSEANPRTRDEPSTAVTAMKESSMIAK